MKHIHKYFSDKYKKSGTEIFRCGFPECNTIILKRLAIGKISICWRCGEEFVMTREAAKLKHPHCGCVHEIKADESIVDNIDELLGGLK